MNATLVEHGGRIAGEEVFRRAPGLWRDSLFGFIPMPLVWNFVAVLLVVLIFWWLIHNSQKNAETAMNLLKRRYVTGEIDRETYLKMKKDIAD